MQRVILYLLLISRFLHHIKASAHFNRLNSATSAAITYDNQETWQPMSRNNWIILQTAEQNPHTYTNMNRHNMNANSQTSQLPSQTQTQSQRYPTNYYAYNHSAGNYQPSTPEVKVVEPFVLAISNVRRSTDYSSASALQRKAPVPLANMGPKLPPKDIARKMNSSGATVKPLQADVRRKMFANDADNVGNNVPDDAADDYDEKGGDGAADDEDDDERLNEILEPLENALDKVRQFCDIAKRIISDDAEIDGNELDTAAALATPVAQATSVLGKVQGRANSSPNAPESKRTAHQASASEDAAALSIGTGRKVKKLKKKFKKFLLPLLIAYKLKFLTLIPVLIGGLTLLVGTTGLAGFFFALFTAVMSLKSSGGSKSIVVKKIS